MPRQEWIVKPINLQALLEPIDPIYRVTDKLSVIGEVLGEVKPKLSPVLQKFLEVIAPKLTFKILQSDQFYNELLKRDRTSGMDILLPIPAKADQAGIRQNTNAAQTALERGGLQTGPDYLRHSEF